MNALIKAINSLTVRGAITNVRVCAQCQCERVSVMYDLQFYPAASESGNLDKQHFRAAPLHFQPFRRHVHHQNGVHICGKLNINISIKTVENYCHSCVADGLKMFLIDKNRKMCKLLVFTSNGMYAVLE